MSLTYQDLISEVRHASGAGQTGSVEGPSFVDVATQAIGYFNSMHGWEGMIRPEKSISLVAGQDYIDLGEDVRDVIKLAYNQGEIAWFEWRGAAEITELRAREGDDSTRGGYYGCRETRVVAGSGALIQAVSLYPAVTASVTDAFRLRYRALLLPPGDLDQDTAYMGIPPLLEPLLRRLARIYSESIYERDGRDLEDRLEGLERSQALEKLKQADGALQPELGPTLGGAALMNVTGHVNDDWWDSEVGLS